MTVARRTLLQLGLAATLTAALSSCAAPASVPAARPKELRFGYFPNLTHAPAIIALEQGYLQERLGSVKVVPTVFNAGPAAIEALFAGALDIGFIGPNPTITGFSQSNGEALRVIAGSSSGGAGLVLRSGIDAVGDLKGVTLATPQLGNTQDVALRYWLQVNGLTSTKEGGGDVHITPTDNASALQAFIAGEIDGAWVPEPWLSRLASQDGATIFVDEASLWPDGRFVVANVIAATQFLERYPKVVEDVIAAELDALDYLAASPAAAKKSVNDHLESLTGSRLDDALLDAAWSRIEFTYDPLPATLLGSAEHAHDVGLLDEVDLDGVYALEPLNSVLAARGLTGIDDL